MSLVGCVLSITDHLRLASGRTHVVDGFGLHGDGALIWTVWPACPSSAGRGGCFRTCLHVSWPSSRRVLSLPAG